MFTIVRTSNKFQMGGGGGTPIVSLSFSIANRKALESCPCGKPDGSFPTLDSLCTPTNKQAPVFTHDDYTDMFNQGFPTLIYQHFTILQISIFTIKKRYKLSLSFSLFFSNHYTDECTKFRVQGLRGGQRRNPNRKASLLIASPSVQVYHLINYA